MSKDELKSTNPKRKKDTEASTKQQLPMRDDSAVTGGVQINDQNVKSGLAQGIPRPLTRDEDDQTKCGEWRTMEEI
ncbi:MAG: hypothetical protein LBJ95_03905 [Oscillospiraceae bacterium]|nr:hypothetical protein [Oscillospiraceae bacterium]